MSQSKIDSLLQRGSPTLFAGNIRKQISSIGQNKWRENFVHEMKSDSIRNFKILYQQLKVV